MGPILPGGCRRQGGQYDLSIASAPEHPQSPRTLRPRRVAVSHATSGVAQCCARLLPASPAMVGSLNPLASGRSSQQSIFSRTIIERAPASSATDWMPRCVRRAHRCWAGVLPAGALAGGWSQADAVHRQAAGAERIARLSWWQHGGLTRTGATKPSRPGRVCA